MNTIHKQAKDNIYNLPIFGAAADIQKGAFLMRGATPGTNNGELILATGAGADIIGRLGAMLDYSVDGETLIAGTAFVTKPVELAHGFRIHRVEYDLTDVMTASQAVTTTTITLTSLEDDIDAAFLYVAAGTGIGQTNYLTASASGSATLKAAFGTSLDTTSDIIKILPRFHPLGKLNSDGTKLGTDAAAGSWTIMVIDSYIQRNGRIEQLNPTKHAALTGLNSLRNLKFFADIAVRNTGAYTID